MASEAANAGPDEYAAELAGAALTRVEVQRLFLAAVSLLDAQLVSALLGEPNFASVAWVLPAGLPALHYAASCGDVAMLRALLGAVARREAAQEGPPPAPPASGRGSARGPSARDAPCPALPFYGAARAPNTRVGALLALKDGRGWSALHVAAWAGQAGAVSLLLDAAGEGAEVLALGCGERALSPVAVANGDALGAFVRAAAGGWRGGGGCGDGAGGDGEGVSGGGTFHAPPHRSLQELLELPLQARHAPCPPMALFPLHPPRSSPSESSLFSLALVSDGFSRASQGARSLPPRSLCRPSEPRFSRLHLAVLEGGAGALRAAVAEALRAGAPPEPATAFAECAAYRDAAGDSNAVPRGPAAPAISTSPGGEQKRLLLDARRIVEASEEAEEAGAEEGAGGLPSPQCADAKGGAGGPFSPQVAADAALSPSSHVDVRGPAGVTPLMLAWGLGRMGAGSELVAAGASLRAVDDAGRTPLHHLCYGAAQDSAVYHVLQALGGEEEPPPGAVFQQLDGVQSCLLPTKDAFSLSWLHAAALQGRPIFGGAVVAGLLARAGAPALVALTEALALAALGGHAGVCAQLLTHGAEPLGSGFDGRSPFQAAAHAGHAQVLQLLSAAAPAGWLWHAPPGGACPLAEAAAAGHDAAARGLLLEAALPALTAQLRRPEALVKALGRYDPTGLRWGRWVESAAEGGCEGLLGWLLHGRAGGHVPASALLAAAKGGHAGALRALLAAVPSAAATADALGDSLLHHAAFRGHAACVRALLRVPGVPASRLLLAPNSDGGFPLHAAANCGSVGVGELLLRAGAAPEALAGDGSSAVGNAAFEGHGPFVALLRRFGARADAADGAGRTPLIEAASNGHTGAVAALLAPAPAPAPAGGAHARGLAAPPWWPLIPAPGDGVGGGSGGRDSPPAPIDAGDAGGDTPLHWAAWGGHYDTVLLLLRSGARTDVPNGDGGTCIHTAAMRDAPACLTALLGEGGADPDARFLPPRGGRRGGGARQGGTALHAAARAGHVAPLRVLLAARAAVGARDAAGATPLHEAMGVRARTFFYARPARARPKVIYPPPPTP